MQLESENNVQCSRLQDKTYFSWDTWKFISYFLVTYKDEIQTFMWMENEVQLIFVLMLSFLSMISAV